MTAPLVSAEARRLVQAALAALGVERCVIGIPDRSFPVSADADTGSGSPHGSDGARFLDFVATLGFDGIQLGPQGDTSAGNPSPYDGTTFSRGHVALSLEELAAPSLGALLPRERVAAIVAARPPGPPDRVAYRFAHAAHGDALRRAFANLLRRLDAGGDAEAARLAERIAAFAARQAAWLERDALHAALERRYGGAHWRDWNEALDRRLFAPLPGEEEVAAGRRRELAAACALEMARYRFVQFVAHAEHDGLRQRAHGAGLRLYGDLPIGLSPRDAWGVAAVVWDDYRMGAPPSRTNPSGQTWGYPVLDPRCPVAARACVRERFEKLFAEYDAVRVDHPHGLVDPWVYDPRDPDPLHAVQAGARLLSSPDLPDHPALAAIAIARSDQLNPDPATPRHADAWVVALEDAQVERYGALFAEVLAAARAHGASEADVVCEVLSTQPYPLARVLERHGLGRFRVTQKADLRDPRDVYRGENARPADWIMVGNHDTPPIWALAPQWSPEVRRERAAYLAARLARDAARRERLATHLAGDVHLLAQAQLADLFVGPARHVMVFFTDVFGLRDSYNQPGEVAEENWTLRLTPADVAAYPARAARGAALHLPLALASALRGREPAFRARHAKLIEALAALCPDRRLLG